jgi:protein-S-isoprenylcysteine O-methyltransferase Ste14
MAERRAVWGSLLFFAVAPGSTAGLVPWLITRWHSGTAAWAEVAGAIVTLTGATIVIAAFVQFVIEGRGTPAPVAPTQELVVGGLYRWVRNPMYLGVATAIAGQALAFGNLGVVLWLAVFVLAVTSFVIGYEEPTLRRSYGTSYDAYASAVHRWLPRARPWSQDLRR